MILEINKNDYNNLKINYSDKNIISRTQGKEYFIDNSSIVRAYFNDNPNKQELEITPQYNINGSPMYGNTIKDHNKKSNIWGSVYARSEGCILKGQFESKIDEVIYDKNSISVNFEIDYDTYKRSNSFPFDSLINNDNYSSANFVYNQIISNNNLQNKDVDNNRTPQILSNSVFEKTMARSKNEQWFIGEAIALIDTTWVKININSILVDTLSGTTTISASYEIIGWYAWNNKLLTTFIIGSYSEEFLQVIRSLKFTVQANTVNIIGSDFDYGDYQQEPYSLESNEFMQYQNGEDIENRLSYTQSQNIFEKTERNRMILTFNLLRLEQYDWEDGQTKRYIASRDLIKLKDEMGNYIGQYYNNNGDLVIPEFKIISANGKWNGKFYKEIVAMQVFID